MIGARPETPDEAMARADNLKRLLWLILRQIGGRFTIQPETMMAWNGDAARLVTLQDMSTGGITLVAEIDRPITPDDEVEMQGFRARDEGKPCRPPDHLNMTQRMLWVEGWKLRDGAEELASSDIPSPKE